MILENCKLSGRQLTLAKVRRVALSYHRQGMLSKNGLRPQRGLKCTFRIFFPLLLDLCASQLQSKEYDHCI